MSDQKETPEQFQARKQADLDERNAYGRRQHEARMAAFGQDISGYTGDMTMEDYDRMNGVPFDQSTAALGQTQNQSGHENAPAGPWSNVSDPAVEQQKPETEQKPVTEQKPENDPSNGFWFSEGVRSFKA